MNFSSPWNLLFLSFIPLVVLMYILKQKFEERQVSSIYLWEQVLKDIEVNTPWQKLKKNILLLLQILAVLFLVFSLANPSVFINGGKSENLIVVIDTTGSMNTRYENTTRLQAAKNMADETIKSSNNKVNFTIITLGKLPKVEVNTSDKNQARARLKDIKPSNAKGEISEVLSLVKALSKQQDSTRTVIYTDSNISLEGINGEIVSLASKSENVSIDYISHSQQEGKYKVMTRISNRTSNDVNREISLYGDGNLIDILDIEIDANSIKTVYFDKVPLNISYLNAEITEKDDLIEDNVIYDVVRQTDKKRALILTNKNVFIEKALNNISSLELFKANNIEKITDKFDLHVFDGEIPKEIPSEGSILLINPPENNGIVNILGNIEGGISHVEKHPLNRYIEGAYFTIASLKRVEIPYWADAIIKVGDKPAVLVGELKGRKICVINFDIHNSDFSLTPEFPIFMHNTIGYLVGAGFEGKSSYYSGDSVQIDPIPEAVEAAVKTPSETIIKTDIKYPAMPFDKTSEAGIYTLIQKTRDKEIRNMFAVNFPTEYESKSDPEVKSVQNDISKTLGLSQGRNIQLPLLILLLAILVTEWVVYTRGY
jgi:hypothetical protein